MSRNTVAVAYDRLVAEGFLTSRPGVGMTVGNVVRSHETRPITRAAPLQARPVWDVIPEFDDQSASAPVYDFRPGIPAAGEFPYATWRRLLANESASSTRAPTSKPRTEPSIVDGQNLGPLATGRR